MSEFWSFSGINSVNDAGTALADYVWVVLNQRGVSRAPDRHYISELGTGSYYPKEKRVVGLDSEKKLDAEARAFAKGDGTNPAIEPGCFRGKRVKVLLVAPKTTTDPPRVPGLDLSIYWAPNDVVPNQGLLRPDTLKYWRKFTRGASTVYPIHNVSGGFFGRGHSFAEFMRDDPTTMRQVTRTKRSGGRRRVVREWRATKRTAPTGPKLINKWLNDGTVDHVLVGHSQGTNILIHCLERGYA